MDWQAAFNILFTAFMVLVSGVGGWFGNTLWRMVRELEKHIADIREHVPVNYATKVDLKDAMEKVFHKLERIEDYLKTKVDK